MRQMRMPCWSSGCVGGGSQFPSHGEGYLPPCRAAGVILSDATSVTEVAGHGLQAEVDASQVLTGNAKLLAAHGVEMPASVVA